MNIKRILSCAVASALMVGSLSIAPYVYAEETTETPQTEKDDRPNVLILLEDDGSNHYSYIGTKGVKTPNIDALAESGVAFTNAFSTTATCTCARAAILTGMYTSKNGQWTNVGEITKTPGTELVFSPEDTTYKVRPTSGVMPQYETLFEVAKNNGYATGMFQKWHISPVWRFPVDYGTVGNDSEQMEQFLDMVGEDTPWMVQINFPETHRPWHDRPGFEVDPNELELPDYLPDNAFFRNDYANYLMNRQFIDAKIGRIVQVLKDRGEYENTIIIFTSDQGYAYQFAKGTLYHEATKVGFIMTGPGIERKGTVCNDVTSHVDIMPTLVDLLDWKMDAEKKSEMQGISYKAYLQGNADTPGRKYAFADYGAAGNVRMITDGTYYLVRNIDARDPNYEYPFVDDIYPPNEARENAWKNYVFRELNSDREKYAEAWEIVNRQIHRQYEEMYRITDDYCCMNNLLAQDSTSDEIAAKYAELRAALDDLMASMDDDGTAAYIAQKVTSVDTFDKTNYVTARWQTLGVNATPYHTDPNADPDELTGTETILLESDFDNGNEGALLQTGTKGQLMEEDGALKLTQTDLSGSAMELFYSSVPVYKKGETGIRVVSFDVKLSKNDAGTSQNIFVQLGNTNGSVALAGALFQGVTMPKAVDYGGISPVAILNTAAPITLNKLPDGYDDGNFHNVKLVYKRQTATAGKVTMYWDGEKLYEHAITYNDTTDLVMMFRLYPGGAGLRRPGATEVTSWIDNLKITKIE